LADGKPEWVRRNERLAERYGGFVHPWRSTIDPDNGEDAYTALAREQLRAELDVVEAGCGHGSDALSFAPHVRTYLGYDAVGAFVGTARRRAAAANLRNVEFVTADSSPKRGGRVPAGDCSVDLILSRRGPSNFVLDSRRVCRPGATLLQVCYLATPIPDWDDSLPPELRLPEERDTAPASVAEYLAAAGLRLQSSRVFDVEERFDHPAELLRRLSWDREESRDETRDLEAVSALFGSRVRVSLRHRRLVWQAIVP
jgi:SAM-dependent methyltransferase